MADGVRFELTEPLGLNSLVDCRLQPLGHPSLYNSSAERQGIEPCQPFKVVRFSKPLHYHPARAPHYYHYLFITPNLTIYNLNLATPERLELPLMLSPPITVTMG